MSGAGPSTAARVAIVGALAGAVALVLALRPAPGASSGNPDGGPALPRLVDLGANSCAPCKAMMPILDELRREKGGRLRVEFVDVWADPGAAEKLKVRILPTQLFLDAAGRELARHEGFMSKEAILGRWRELGIPLD